MKPRPVPTSPKQKAENQGIEALYRTDREIVRPAPAMTKAVLTATLLSAIAVLGAVLGLFWLARRFPQQPLLRPFVLEVPSRESVIIREQPQEQQRRTVDLTKKVEASLGTLVEKGKGDPRAPSDRRGLMTFVSSDGVGLAVNGAIPSGEQLAVEVADGTELLVKTVAPDPATSLVLVRVSGSSTALPLSDIDDLVQGSEVWIVRFDPLAGGLSIVETKLVTLRDRPLDGETFAALLESSEVISRRLRVAAPLDSSWNGAAVIDANGRLIGLFEASHGPGGGLVVPAAVLRNQLSRFSRGEGIRRTVLGVHYLDLAYASAPGLPEKGAYVSGNEQPNVQAVKPNSPAAQARVRSRDIVTAVDGTPVNNFHALSEILATYEAGASVTLEVFRGKESLKLDVTLGTSEGAT